MKVGMIYILACNGDIIIERRDCFAVLAMTEYSHIFLKTVAVVIASLRRAQSSRSETTKQSDLIAGAGI
jgi:hypothetical protein